MTDAEELAQLRTLNILQQQAHAVEHARLLAKIAYLLEDRETRVVALAVAQARIAALESALADAIREIAWWDKDADRAVLMRELLTQWQREDYEARIAALESALRETLITFEYQLKWHANSADTCMLHHKGCWCRAEMADLAENATARLHAVLEKQP